jgi:hypothetical protein
MPSPSRSLRPFLGLAAGLLMSAVLVTTLLVGSGNAAETSRLTYDEIRMGMARQEAEAILGDWPQRLARADRTSATVEWEAPDGSRIEVDFNSDGRVTGKHIAEFDPSLPARMKRLVNRFVFR